MASVQVPTLVIDGEDSAKMTGLSAQPLAVALADGRYRTLNGLGYDIVPDIVGPVLEELFSG